MVGASQDEMNAELSPPLARPARGGRGEAITLPSAAARAKAMRDARRNTAWVRMLRYVCPALIVGLLGFYVTFLNASLTTADNERKAAPKLTFDGPIISSDGLGMTNPRYEGFDDDGSRYVVTAARAVSDISKKKGPIDLETINGRLIQPDETVTRVEATRGTYNQASDILSLFDGVVVRNSGGLTARLVTANVWPKRGWVNSAEPVEIEMASGTVWGQKLNINNNRKIAKLSSGVKARLKPTPPNRSADASASAPAAGLPGLDFAASSNNRSQPIVVTSTALLLDYAKQYTRFDEKVVATQGTTRMTSDALRIDYTQTSADGAKTAAGGDSALLGVTGATNGGLRALTATGNVTIVQPDRVTRAAKLTFDPKKKAAVLSGGVRIDEAGQQTVTAKTATLFQDDQRALLTGGIRIVSGDAQSAVASRAELDQRAQTALLVGRVLVSQGRNTLSGERLFADQAAQRMTLTAKGAKGRIAAR
ncbi:MAG: LPS export ABC transporter periplasmic protein LptC, partial [Pseudomonadota bacterium]